MSDPLSRLTLPVLLHYLVKISNQGRDINKTRQRIIFWKWLRLRLRSPGVYGKFCEFRTPGTLPTRQSGVLPGACQFPMGEVLPPEVLWGALKLQVMDFGSKGGWITDRHQNVISWSLGHTLAPHKISSKSVGNFFNNPVNVDFGLRTPGSGRWSGSSPKLNSLVPGSFPTSPRNFVKSVHNFFSYPTDRQTNRPTWKHNLLRRR